MLYSRLRQGWGLLVLTYSLSERRSFIYEYNCGK